MKCFHYISKKEQTPEDAATPIIYIDAFTNSTCENFNKMRFKAIAKVSITSLSGKKSAELYG